MISGTMMIMQMMELLKTMVEKMEEEWHQLVGKVDNLMITVNNTTVKVKDMEQDIHNAINDAISNMSNCPDMEQRIVDLETLQTDANDELYNAKQQITQNEDNLTRIKNGLTHLLADLE